MGQRASNKGVVRQGMQVCGQSAGVQGARRHGLRLGEQGEEGNLGRSEVQTSRLSVCVSEGVCSLSRRQQSY